MDQRFAYSPADLARVKTVQFGILGPDEIVRSRFFSCPELVRVVQNSPSSQRIAKVAKFLDDSKVSGVSSRSHPIVHCADKENFCSAYFSSVSSAHLSLSLVWFLVNSGKCPW